MSPTYEVTFEAYVRIDAKNASDAIKEAWLQKNLDNATYKFIDVKMEVIKK